MKSILLFLGLLIAPAFAAASGDAALLADATQLRMLSQRMPKAYAQLGLNILPADAKQQLGDAVASTNAALDRLRRSRDKQLAAQISLVNTVWLRLRPQVESAVARERAPQLADDAEQLLAASEKLTHAIQDRANLPAGRLFATASRLRMLSQRIVKAYMLQQWGVSVTASRDQIDAASHEFEGALEFLRTRPDITPETRLALDDLSLQWEWFRTALQTEGALSFRLIILESSEAILSAADRVAELYSAPSAR